MDSGPQNSPYNYRDESRYKDELFVLPNLNLRTLEADKTVQLLPINVALPELKYWQDQINDTSEEEIWKRRNLKFHQRHQIKPLVRPCRRQDRVPHLKKDSKLSIETKVSNFQEYIKIMKSHGYTQTLMRTRVVRELGITRTRLQPPLLVMKNWYETLHDIQTQTMALNLEQQTFNMEHALSCQRSNRGNVIELYFSPISHGLPAFKLIVHSAAIRQPQGGYRWFHYVKGATYVNLAIFLLGSDFNYSINDNLVEPTIGNDLKVISSKKRCISRLRSHAKNSMIANPFPTSNDTGGSVMELNHIEPKLHKLLHHHTFLQLS